MNDAAVHLQLLGGFVVSVGDAAIPEAQWKSRRARSLVKLLALAPGHRLHRDQVIDSLWPEFGPFRGRQQFPPDALRRAQDTRIGRGIILSAGRGLSEPVRCEMGKICWWMSSCLRPRLPGPKARIRRLTRMPLALYTGDLLPEDLYEEWTIQRREALRQVCLNLLLDLARLHEARQDYPAAIETLLRLLAMDKSHEEAHAGLMRLYALSGQRQQALRQYLALRDALHAELDAEPGQRTTQLYEDIQAGRISPAAPAATAHRHNLPAELTSFIGREKQIEEVSQLVRDHRLVTLTGSGGTGKTRLALKAAEGLLEHFPDGVFLVELAPLSDPDLVPQACVQSPGTGPSSPAFCPRPPW